MTEENQTQKFPTYPKKPGPYSRNPETKKIEPGLWSNPQLQALDQPGLWIWTEKVDGTNIRVMWDGYKVSFGGRTDRANLPGPLLQYLEDTYGSDEAEEIFEQQFGLQRAVVFGEGYGPGIQKGGVYRDDVSFIGFDLWVGGQHDQPEKPSGYFQDYETGRAIMSHALNVPLVPEVDIEMSITEACGYVGGGHNNSIVAGLNNKKTFECEGLIGVPKIPFYNQYHEQIAVKIKPENVA